MLRISIVIIVSILLSNVLIISCNIFDTSQYNWDDKFFYCRPYNFQNNFLIPAILNNRIDQFNLYLITNNSNKILQ